MQQVLPRCRRCMGYYLNAYLGRLHFHDDTTTDDNERSAQRQKNKDHGKETETVSSATIATSRRLVGDRGIGALGMVSVFTTKTKGFQQAQSFFHSCTCAHFNLTRTMSCIICQFVVLQSHGELTDATDT